MARKRKAEATRLDEVDRTMYFTFCSAANSLSQLYTQAMNQQKISFQAGERHALEKLYQWILRQHEEGSRVGTADIVSYIQNEIDYGGEDASVSPRLQQHPQQHPPGSIHFPNSGIQTKNSVFSNALSSPVRQSLQTYHLAQGGGGGGGGGSSHNGVMPTSRNHDVSSGSNPPGSNDLSMDMHSDSPTHGSY